MRTDWVALEPVEFDGLVEPLVWGRSTYVILQLPSALVEAAAALGTRRLEGRIEELEVNVGVNRNDEVPAAFMYVGTPLARRLGVRVGDLVRCSLRPADPDLVPLPEDVREALQAAGALAAFEARRPPQRRQLLMPIDAAATEATRRRRIGDLISGL